MHKHKLAALAATGAVAALLAGCSTPAAPVDHRPAYPAAHIGDETVYAIPVNASIRAYSTVEEFAAIASVIVVGTLTAAQDVAKEVAVDPSEEGVAPGEGPDLYGALTFTVTSVVKAPAKPSTVKVWYESGKRDASDPKKRIGNLHAGLSRLQRPDSSLRSPSEFAGRTFVVMLTANKSSMKLSTGEYPLAHPLGIAEVLADGTLLFGDGSVSPVMVGSTLIKVTLDQLKAAVK
ncbi:hypothetical protein ACFO1B_46920 [Dactylosporangium siamense]|uniref:Lipoprotein n=1 Tax=Dactylosporangium siamense TaxID=685454 RepID=A0A919PWU1_9ACTN|nr:hypothetical protein [Dactylosporangium siamense]GIG51754.1 hypothetical protein Dsi01nite_097950 [Dactylosporangium siamense]